MADEDLQLLRAKRLQELQQQRGEVKPQGSNEVDRKEREEELKNSILSQILTQEARSRLSTISIAKPENGRVLENMIINMARTGQIRTKLADEQFIELLKQVNQQIQQNAPKVKFDRRRAGLDSDDEI